MSENKGLGHPVQHEAAGDTQGLREALRGEYGPWLLWSHYHGMWHRRVEDGAAAGYTQDVWRAGVFELSKAEQYNDYGMPGGRDEAIPLNRAVSALERRLIELDLERADVAKRLSLLSDGPLEGHDDTEGKPT